MTILPPPPTALKLPKTTQGSHHAAHPIRQPLRHDPRNPGGGRQGADQRHAHAGGNVAGGVRGLSETCDRIWRLADLLGWGIKFDKAPRGARGFEDLVWPGGLAPPAWRYSENSVRKLRVPSPAWISPTVGHVPACFTVHLQVYVCIHMNLHGWNGDFHRNCACDPDGDCPRTCDGNAQPLSDPHSRTLIDRA